MCAGEPDRKSLGREHHECVFLGKNLYSPARLVLELTRANYDQLECVLFTGGGTESAPGKTGPLTVCANCDNNVIPSTLNIKCLIIVFARLGPLYIYTIQDCLI